MLSNVVPRYEYAKRLQTPPHILDFTLFFNPILNVKFQFVEIIPFLLWREFKVRMWNAIDQEIQLRDSQIYSLIPDPDSDPFAEDGNMYTLV
jgi:hypothetical protein